MTHLTPISITPFSVRSPDGLGVDPGPLDLFDLFGLMEDTEGFARRRAVEIKQGRVTMAAFIGMMFQELRDTYCLLLKGNCRMPTVR